MKAISNLDVATHVVANCVHDVSGVSLRAGAENFVSLRFSSLSPRKHVVGLRGDFVCRGPQKNAPSRAKRDFSLTKGPDAAAICASSPLRNAFRKGRRLHLGEKGSTIQVKDGKCAMRLTFHESPEAALPDMNRWIGTISSWRRHGQNFQRGRCPCKRKKRRSNTWSWSMT